MICPAPRGSLYGNRVTARRWAAILRALGHRVTIAQSYQGETSDALVALHARRSAGAVFRFREERPGRPIVVALTGTDLYRDIRTDRDARRALEAADRLVALQDLAAEELAPHLRSKLAVIHQSAPRTPWPVRRSGRFFDVCVVGHLREVKDPFRAALAARKIPESSRIRVLHAGEAMEESFAAEARAEQDRNSRYRWLGGIPRWKTRRLIAASRLMVLSSQMEGGANTISEALVDGTPVLASRIPGSVGLLGAGYPGFFPPGDTEALARLMERAEGDRRFYATLEAWCRRLRPMFHPSRERAAWRRLIGELRSP